MDAVTPQMYGAKADGIADDTAAFQKAVDSGYDVYVPTSRRETYRITGPIRITKSQCKRIYSEPAPRAADQGSIIFDLTGATTDPKAICLFDVQIQLLLITGLRFTSKVVNSARAGILISAMNADICDYDIRIERCYINRFYKVTRFTGRGFEMANTKVGSCQYLLELHWDDSKDSNSNHPAQYDQRGISIKNCRLHHIINSFILVKSGHAYGLHFIGNTIDNGSGYIVRAYDQAWGWNISGNVIQGIHGNFDAMDFRKGMQNCVIANNTFLSDIGYWEGKTEAVNSWLKCGGVTSFSAISNNVFKNTSGAFMSFKTLDGTAIIGNAMQNTLTSTSPAIVVSGTNKRSSITGNTTSATKMI